MLITARHGIIALAVRYIYMEAMLRKVSPHAERHQIALSMFADNLTAWTTGRDIAKLQNKLTYIIKHISQWNKHHNMSLSEKHGKCKSILFTNNRNDPSPVVYVNNKVLLAVKKTTLLGVKLDAQLTMKPQFDKLMT
jgi:hypothetical protein